MRKLLCLTLVVMASLTVGLATAPRVSAEEKTCRGSFGHVTFDNVRVPSGARVTGAIQVFSHRGGISTTNNRVDGIDPLPYPKEGEN